MADKVLVVDDGPINLKILAALLRKAGLDFVSATNGDDAIALARSEHPDLILLDVMMPGRDGFDVCGELKAGEDTADIPVIFLSALGESGDKVKGLALGAADYVTKPFDTAEVLARVKTQLRLRHATRALVEKQRALEEDLRAAADIQRALIPREHVRIPRLGLAWLFEPCHAIGGDVFNVIPLDDEHVALYVLDVNGHGVPPAMVAVSVSQSLTPGAGLVLKAGERGSRAQICTPVEVLTELDREYPLERFERYFTMAYLVLHLPSGRLTHSNAGHPPPAVLGVDGRLRLLDEGGPIIGLGNATFDGGTTSLIPGDRVFLYTDGITEFEAPDQSQFGDERFHDLLKATRGGSLREVCAAVHQALVDFGGGKAPHDDVSLLAAEYLPA
jgi:phosphoserine phosphatase RsbU/P